MCLKTNNQSTLDCCVSGSEQGWPLPSRGGCNGPEGDGETQLLTSLPTSMAIKGEFIQACTFSINTDSIFKIKIINFHDIANVMEIYNWRYAVYSTNIKALL